VNDDDVPKEKTSDAKLVSPQRNLPASPNNLPVNIPAIPTMLPPNPNAAANAGQTAEPQLQYLASLQGFKVQFTDFPKDGQFLR